MSVAGDYAIRLDQAEKTITELRAENERLRALLVEVLSSPRRIEKPELGYNKYVVSHALSMRIRAELENK